MRRCWPRPTRRSTALVAAEPPPPDTVGKHFWFPSTSAAPGHAPRYDESGARSIAEELTAPHRLQLILNHIQVTLNIPPHGHRPGGPHIDGHVRQHPGQQAPHSFTLLAGIFLSDKTEIDQGSVWVSPGWHLVHQQLFHDRGTDVLMTTGGHVTMLDDPPVLGPPVPRSALRRPSARALPARSQHRRQPHQGDKADALLPPRLFRPPHEVERGRFSINSRNTNPCGGQ